VSNRVDVKAADLLHRYLPRGEFARGALTLVAGTGLAQLISTGSAPILTRLYAPSEYGEFAVAASILSVFGAVVCLTYDYAIPLPESDDRAASVLVLCLVTAAFVSLAAALLFVVAGPTLITLAGAATISPFVLLLAVGVLGSGVVTAFTGWAIRTKAYRQIATTRLAQSTTLVATQVVFGILRMGAPGLLIGLVVGSFARSTSLARFAWRGHSDAIRRVTKGGVWSAAKRYRRFPVLSAPSALINELGLQAPVLLLVAFYGVTAGGHLALALRMIGLPAAFMQSAMSQAYLSEAASRARTDPSKIRPLFWRTTRSLAMGASGPFLLAALAAPFIFGLAFGDAWAEAGLYVAILAPMYFLQFVTSPTGATLDILERQDLHLMREVARLVVTGGAVLCAAQLHVPATGAVVAVGVAGCVTYVLYGTISWRAIVASDERGRRRELHRAAAAGQDTESVGENDPE
jgi:O-antigen/teichoic acid export membrane protein